MCFQMFSEERQHIALRNESYFKQVMECFPDNAVLFFARVNVDKYISFLKKDMKIIYSDLDKMLLNNPEKIVLGCTHYPYLLKTLSNFAPVETFIDPADYFVDYIVNDLSNSNLLNQSSNIGYEKIYVSANPQQFQNAAEMFYKVNKLPQLV